MADRSAGAPLFTGDLPAPFAALLREAWKLGPSPEEDLYGQATG